MAIVWTGEGIWAGWVLTTDHASSSHGQPVLVDPDGKAYGPGDIRPDRLFQTDLAAARGTSRAAITDLINRNKLPPYDGHLGTRGWWYRSTLEREGWL